ncbi:hypothetical protein COU20_02615 [Candidatus Kaiserbacteria bacterium CG10_big_fil_rev_8_21_14_0_10_59_10]|uniref:GerMN domain-containing protein n=1 Tax=Candidatus Kaiserbacteria bacterium CG10_big_fil_rev_8_21_14_0_10_59_10 TaxID=1974612 RepID=A0A2H0U7L2_9BACT|nr:MAG: hypothetical protein COU20_02615 [Candidatus Kaiserbacteria bacterium CG10_big_fil_rev_8_21_14_0_10_59_10]
MNKTFAGFLVVGLVVVLGIAWLMSRDVEEEPLTYIIQLYYYNPELDTDATGNVMCSRAGLVPVQREITTHTPIEDTIRLLLSGELTEEERAAGITTEYPLEGFELVSATLEDGVLTFTFNDPEGRTVGGSCRVGILWAQIDETARQYEGVEEVRFLPEELFQP